MMSLNLLECLLASLRTTQSGSVLKVIKIKMGKRKERIGGKKKGKINKAEKRK
jgi:hypothetical protein